jgi:cytochrome b6-f complex iron-sulfur subunit
MASGPGLDRRKIVNWLLGVTGASTVGSILYPIFRFLTPPEVVEATTTTVEAATLDELPVNGWKIFRFGTRPGIIIRISESEFRAFAATCTHLDCIVQYRDDKRMIWCACHNGLFDLSGRNVSGPPPRPLETYRVNVVGEKVYASKT